MNIQIINKKKSDLEIMHHDGTYLLNVELFYKAPNDSEVRLTVNEHQIVCNETNTRRDDKKKCNHFQLNLFEISEYPETITLESNDQSIDLMNHKQVRVKTPTVSHHDIVSLQSQIENLSEAVSQTMEANANENTDINTDKKIEELTQLLQTKSDTTHNHDAMDIEGLIDMFELKAPSQHQHVVADINDLPSHLETVIDSKLDVDNIKGIEAMIQKHINEKVNTLIDLKKFQTMEQLIKNHQYLHISKVEVFPNEAAPEESIVWVKMLSNLVFNHTGPSVENATTVNAIDKSVTESMSSNNIQIDDLTELKRDEIGISFSSTVPIEFIQCIILPQGPKSLQDYPIGNKKYEWLESEIHIQFTTTAELKKMSLSEKKISISYQGIEMASTHLKNHQQSDWQHYYVNYMNTFTK